MNTKNKHLPVQTTLQSHGRLLSLEEPVVMGILNATTDSFYNVSGNHLPTLLKLAETMLQDGAAILDIGGASTRPGAAAVTPEEELGRMLPLIEAILRRFPGTWLSVDTYHAKVAQEAVAAGVSIVNDISGGTFDDAMYETVGKLQVPYIAMHTQGRPEHMQDQPYYNDVAAEVLDHLQVVTFACKKAGIRDIIVDPGFGFGKTVAHNYQLLRSLHLLNITGYPILAGISRKSMIYKPLNSTPAQALHGTGALHMVALQQGARILRVHDVKEAREVIRLYDLLQNS